MGVRYHLMNSMWARLESLLLVRPVDPICGDIVVVALFFCPLLNRCRFSSLQPTVPMRSSACFHHSHLELANLQSGWKGHEPRVGLSIHSEHDMKLLLHLTGKQQS